jgi:hypothetical protein
MSRGFGFFETLETRFQQYFSFWGNVPRGPSSGGYTHITAKSALRIDRIYTTSQLTARKTGIETIPAAFSDHNAVTIRIATDKPPNRGRGYWKMNTILLQEKTFSDKLAEEWANWKIKVKYYQTTVMWWTRCVKQRRKILFTMEGAER